MGDEPLASGSESSGAAPAEKTTGPAPPRPTRDALVLPAILAIAAALRFHRIGEESLWTDEVHSLLLARMPVAELIRAAREDVHPPLYFLLLRAWIALFGESAVALRSMSAIVSVLTILPLHSLARKLSGSRAALFSCALFAISPYHLWYAQEARMYALLAFLETLLLFGAWRATDRADARTPGGAILACAPLWVATALLVPTHFFWVFVAAWAGATMEIRARSRDRTPSSEDSSANPRWDRPLLARLAVWGAFACAVGGVFLLQAIRGASTGRGIDWIPPLSPATFVGIFNAFVYGVFLLPDPAWTGAPLAVATGLALLYALRADAFDETRSGGLTSTRDVSKTTSARAILLAGMFCCLGAPLLVSIFRPIVYFGQRYEIIATIPFLLLMGRGLAMMRTRPVLLVAVATTILAGSARYHADYFDSRQKIPYDTAARYLEEKWRPGDVVLCEPESVAACLAMHLDPAIVARPFAPATLDASASGGAPALAAGSRLWFVSVRAVPGQAERARTAGLEEIPPSPLFELEDIPGLFLRITAYESRAGADAGAAGHPAE